MNRLIPLALLALGLMAGCSTARRVSSPYESPTEAQRDSAKAEEFTKRAADVIDRDLNKAEALLRDALAADLYHGPAHNNLGVVFLASGKLYEAANEFEWARKLMPGHPDPRVNLALTLEGAGKGDDAMAAYEAALEVYPGYLPAIMGAATLVVRTGRDDDRLLEWVRELALRAEDSAWRSWAIAQQALLSR